LSQACATAHYWARELRALGHEVRLMPAQYVKAYIKRNKHDAADAEAICEAVERPTMRFVPVKTADQQAAVRAWQAARGQRHQTYPRPALSPDDAGQDRAISSLDEKPDPAGYYLPGQLEQSIEEFVSYYNNCRYHEPIDR
jgi:hypothetical protein